MTTEACLGGYVVGGPAGKFPSEFNDLLSRKFAWCMVRHLRYEDLSAGMRRLPDPHFGRGLNIWLLDWIMQSSRKAAQKFYED